MGRKILDIYNEYKIMPSLQEHMLRVAAVASLICDNYLEPLPKEDIVTICLLHDMGNIIKSQLPYFPDFLQPQGLKYWEGVKADYINKYGKNEHKATIQIIKELGLPTKLSSITEKVDFVQFCNHRDSDDIVTKIIICADTRVTPHGVASYDNRMNEGKKRYENHNKTFGARSVEERDKLVDCGKEIEKQIFAKCRIRPEDINDETVAPIIAELKSFVIK